MKHLFFLFAIVITTTTFAQVQQPSNSIICVNPEIYPEFNGGQVALYQYLIDNLQYPADAKANCIKGTVFVKFVINETGEVSEANVARGLGYGCDEEALRVINSMPSWKPGTQNDKPVSVAFTMPVKFDIADCTVKKEPED
ncbi:MAG: energy transducer TonB [Chitinophagales bacterium]|jgi:protein TonB|nr:energy transducer TonB [Bacteroidota bacterium]MBP8916325.1 energy transducer TonB [Chitinophagales bacterium]MBP9221778.1 energy transducer TonB [Chitinophagales bacterium]MBP9796073.1 energy transducer TonB [Chitinophagales bacterium]